MSESTHQWVMGFLGLGVLWGTLELAVDFLKVSVNHADNEDDR